MNPYADASTLLPGGVNEIPGLDVHWQTFTKHLDQTVDVDGDDVTVKAGSILRICRLKDGRTYATGTAPAVTQCGPDITEIEAPIAPGETVAFEFVVYLTGNPTVNVAPCVRTPPNPTGGFQVVGRSTTGAFEGGAFGADDFNNGAGIVKAGISGTLEGYNPIRIRGTLANSRTPGRLRLQFGPASEGFERLLISDVVTKSGDPGAFPPGTYAWSFTDTQNVKTLLFCDTGCRHDDQMEMTGAGWTYLGEWVTPTIGGIQVVNFADRTTEARYRAYWRTLEAGQTISGNWIRIGSNDYCIGRISQAVWWRGPTATPPPTTNGVPIDITSVAGPVQQGPGLIGGDLSSPFTLAGSGTLTNAFVATFAVGDVQNTGTSSTLIPRIAVGSAEGVTNTWPFDRIWFPGISSRTWNPGTRSMVWHASSGSPSEFAMDSWLISFTLRAE